MAKLNFPTPDLGNPATLTYTDAGITWTWNDALGVWSADVGGSSGGGFTEPVTFTQKTTHEGGVSVTGDSVFNGGINLFGQATFSGLYYEPLDEYLQICHLNQISGTAKFQRKINPEQVGNTSGSQHSTLSVLTLTSGGINSNLSFSRPGAIKAEVKFDDSFVNTSANNDQRIYGVIATGSHDYKRDDVGLDKQAKIGGFAHFLGRGDYAPGDQISFHSDIAGNDNVSLTAFRSEIGTNTNADNYSFYAAGDAPSYFKGPIEAEGTVNATFGSAAAPAYSFLTKENAGVYFADTNRVHIATSGVRRASFGSGLFECPGIYNNTDSSGTDVVVDVDGRLRRKGSSRAYKTNIEPIEYSYAENILNNAQPVYYKPKVQDPEYPQAYLDMLDAQIAAGNTDISPSVYQCEEFCDENNIPWTMDEKWMNEGNDPNLSYWGFIAEDLAEVDPRLTTFNPHLNRYDGVRYAEFTPVLLKICQKQRDQIADLVARIETLETDHATMMNNNNGGGY